jgi:proteasome lid subunit RPN8/RPN11
MLDDIRLAIVDAFCSLPRGGVEIGGVLMGEWKDGAVRIHGYAPLECEHAYGPSFQISANDEARLRELLAQAPAQFPGLVPVGWYHSHTRSEIFLSDDDLTIHHNFFPEPWQIALVLRPRMMQPTRGAFFFREANGEIYAKKAREEFAIEAQGVRAAPVEPVAEMPPVDARPRLVRKERNPEILEHTEPPVVEPPAVVERPSAGAERPAPIQPALVDRISEAEPAPPKPLTARRMAEAPAPSSRNVSPALLSEADAQPAPRRWLVPVLILAGITAGAAGYFTYPTWLPKVMAAVGSGSGTPAPVVAVRLAAVERDGQIQITWDSKATSVRSAVSATLEIADGAQLPRSIALDHAHLQGGAFTYVRQNERVDMKLILHQPDGVRVSEVTTFLGKVPERNADEDPEVRRQRDELAAQASKLKDDLAREAERSRKLEKDIKGIKDEMRQQQKRRMTNMVPEK